MTQGSAGNRGIAGLRALTAAIAEHETNAANLAALVKSFPAETQSRIRVADIFCPKNTRLLEVFHIPPTLKPDMPFLVVPSSSAAGYEPYWAIAEQDYAVRCRCCNNREAVLTLPMLTGETPPPPGYRSGKLAN
jgi:hypothetical protein